jgi:hypothetical protein
LFYRYASYVDEYYIFKSTCTGSQWLMPVIRATQEAQIRSQPGQIVLKSLSQKHPTQNNADRVAQVVEHHPSKHEALSSNTIPVTCGNAKMVQLLWKTV